MEKALRSEILAHLTVMVGPEAEPRPHQLEAIEAVAIRRARVLLVQRTGWGKSAVYFIATRLLRDRGSDPTLLVSPLLSVLVTARSRPGWVLEPVPGTRHSCHEEQQP